MSNIQIVDLPALPEVEEVCLSDIEDELLLSRHFCNFAWLFLASNNAQVSAQCHQLKPPALAGARNPGAWTRGCSSAFTGFAPQFSACATQTP
ncbi:hypothetical protein I5J21_29710, partial [Pseudomonas aeruginosa]|nr:hypothetical protein [Pseudomonas aeruginosa]